MAACLVVVACGQAGDCPDPERGCVVAEQECPAVGLPSGVSLQVDAALAAATDAEVTVCEGDSCRTRRVPLTPATAPGRTTCEGDNCGAELELTGGKSGFAGLDMPAGTVRVTVALFDAANQSVAQGSVETTATGESATTPCPVVGRQVSLAVTTTGVTVI